MRRILTLTLCVLLASAVAARAAVPDMALDRSGTLYRVTGDNGQLVLAVTSPGAEEPTLAPVPQATGFHAGSASVSLDRVGHTAVVAWQEDIGPGLSRVMVATYHDGTWFGPISVSQTGAGSVSAVNPTLLVHRATFLDADGNPYTQAFIHLAWWADPDATDGGHAMYAYMSMDDDGVPSLSDLAPQEVHASIPYGAPCSLLDQAATFNHPKLVVDPQTGDPQLLYADLEQCQLAIVDLHPEPESPSDGDDGSIVAQRKRNVIVFGLRKQIFVRPDIRLDHAQLAIGHNMSVVLFWDVDGGIDYMTMDDQNTSEVSTIKLHEGLNHEQAVQLIQRLAQ